MENVCAACGAIFDPLAPPPEPCPFCNKSAGSASALVDCASCGEKIHSAADRCGYCGHWLRADQERLEQDREQKAYWKERIRISGDQLTCKADEILPGDRCYMCGGSESVRPILHSFRKGPPPAAFLLLFVCGLLPGLLLILLMGKSVSVGVPVCAGCRSAGTWASVGQVLLGVLGFFAIPVAGAFVGHALSAESGAVWGGVVGFGLWLVAILWFELGYARHRRFVCVRVDEGEVTLRFPRPDVVRAAAFGE